MTKFTFMTLWVCLLTSGICSGQKNDREFYREIIRFGIITDIHHTNMADTPTRKYSSALAKTRYFIYKMNDIRADFIIELGDMVDMVTEKKAPEQNLMEIESLLGCFLGPRYHVLGNHEFDALSRSDIYTYLRSTGIPEGSAYFSYDNNGVHFTVLDANYTTMEPHRPFDLQDTANTFWNWKDAFLPQEEVDWLTKDLADSDLPTIIFCHHLLHRDDNDGHTVKNAAAVRSVLEKDGQVLAVFSGHDHCGEVAFVNGIHYVVIRGNVGMNIDWPNISQTDGLHPVKDSPFALVEIAEVIRMVFSDKKTYHMTITGNAQQYSLEDLIVVKSGTGDTRQYNRKR